MNRFKRLFLLLCSLSVFCVGFLSIDNLTVYAYSDADNFYVIDIPNTNFQFNINNWNSHKSYTPVYKDGAYYISNPYLENVFAIVWYNDNQLEKQWTFPYNPEVYDYYILGAMSAKCTDSTSSTFKPTKISVNGLDYDTRQDFSHILSNGNIYDIDTDEQSGFGFYYKISFTNDEPSIHSIFMENDKDGVGNKPENLVVEFGILAVEKTSSELNSLSQILNQLKQMESSITENILNGANSVSSAVGQSAEKISGSIDSAKEELKEKVDEIYEVEDNENFGVGEITEQVEEKLGVLTVGADTLVGFLDLFSSGKGSTEIVFPAFQIEVQGETFNVWNDISYDLTLLEDDFGFLLDSVRTVLVLCVWLAVLSYLVKAKEHLINNRG